jgi:hypothetical protein
MTDSSWPYKEMPMSDDAWDFMQYLAREHEMGRGWNVPIDSFDVRPLCWLGLVEENEEIEFRITNFGLAMLSEGMTRV